MLFRSAGGGTKPVGTVVTQATSNAVGVLVTAITAATDTVVVRSTSSVAFTASNNIITVAGSAIANAAVTGVTQSGGPAGVSGEATGLASTVCALETSCTRGTWGRKFTLTIASTDYTLAGATTGTRAFGTVVNQAGSNAQGKLVTPLTGAIASVVVYSTNGIPFNTVGAITVVDATPTNIVPSAVAEADYTDVFPAWTPALGGQYIKEEAYPASEVTMDWDRQTRRQAGILKRTCVACPAGKVNKNTGANTGALLVRTDTNTGEGQCVALTCAAHRAYATDRSCTPCASNTFRYGAVDTDRTTAATCLGTCAINEYLDGTGTMKCKACALGKVRATGDKIIRADLVKLTVGTKTFNKPIATVVTQTTSGATGKVAFVLPNSDVTEIYMIKENDIAFTTTTGHVITVAGVSATAAAPTAAVAGDATDLAAYEALQLASTINSAQACTPTLCAKDFYNDGSPVASTPTTSPAKHARPARPGSPAPTPVRPPRACATTPRAARSEPSTTSSTWPPRRASRATPGRPRRRASSSPRRMPIPCARPCRA